MTSKVNFCIVRELISMLRATQDASKPRVLLALSGGQDSVGLLATLGRAKEHGRDYVLYAGYINHAVQALIAQQREFETVRALCESESIPLCALSLCIFDSCTPTSEACLRERRYEALFAMAQSSGARYIVTAHHRNDLCESVLMRLFSHGAWQGLSNIPRMRKVHWGNEDIIVLRPALHASPKTFHVSHLPYHVDTSNADTRYMRNACRHAVIPFIEKHFPHAMVRVEACASQVAQLRTLVQSITPPWLVGQRHLVYSFYTFKALSHVQQHHVLFQGANALGIRQLSHGFLEECRKSLLRDGSSIRIARTILMKCGTSMVWKCFEDYAKKVYDGGAGIPKTISVNTRCAFFYGKDNTWRSSESEELESDFCLLYSTFVTPPLHVAFLRKSDIIVQGDKKLNILSMLNTSFRKWRTIPVISDSEGVACVAGEVFLTKTLFRSYENKRAINDTMKLCTITIAYHEMSVDIRSHSYKLSN